MRFINELHEGDRLSGIYLCKQKQAATTKNGKPYENVILQDKTGVLDGKIWDPNSLGIDDFDALDYIDVVGDVTTFAGAMQLNIKRVRKAGEGEYDPADYLPVSENSTDDMYGQLLGIIKTVKNEYLSALLNKLFVDSPAALEIKEGKITATIVWSSPNYDYMIVNDEKYEPVNKDGNSTFEIPVDAFDYKMPVTADTVAMSTPHEIEYTLQFDSASIKAE